MNEGTDKKPQPDNQVKIEARIRTTRAQEISV